MMDNNFIKKKKPISILKIVFLVIAFVIVSFVIYFVFLVLQYKKGIESGEYITYDVSNSSIPFGSNQNTVSRLEIEDAYEPSMGAKNPVMTIVEFGDFSCSKCKQFYPILKKFVADNPDKVKLIYRDFPILDTDYSLASMADCANKQNKFWQMHDKLFEYQSSENLTQELKDQIVLELNLDKDVFKKCIEDANYDNISKDVEVSSKLKLKATPTSLINGSSVEGSLSLDVLKQVLYKIENTK